MIDPLKEKSWTYEKNPDWSPSTGGCVDPLTALIRLLDRVGELPIFDDLEANADLFHAKEAVAAWRQLAADRRQGVWAIMSDMELCHVSLCEGDAELQRYDWDKILPAVDDKPIIVKATLILEQFPATVPT